MSGEKTCFVIGPISQEGTEIRDRSDKVLKHVIEPVVLSCGYSKVIRADRIASPGIITVQMVQHLLEAPLVVADLTGHNPNVFYELAVRHLIRKPLVQLIKADEQVPFDVSSSRVIKLDHTDLDSVARAKAELADHVKAVENDPEAVDNPITAAIDLEAVKRGLKPHDLELAKFLEATLAAQGKLGEAIAALQAEVRSLRAELYPPAPPPIISPGAQSGIIYPHPAATTYRWSRGVARTRGFDVDPLQPPPASGTEPPPEGGKSGPAS